MKTPFLIGLVLATATCVAEETRPANPSIVGKRTPLWDAPAPIGNGATEAANAWITVHQPAEPNGAAVVICPGGGYGRLVVGAEGHGIAKWLNTTESSVLCWNTDFPLVAMRCHC